MWKASLFARACAIMDGHGGSKRERPNEIWTKRDLHRRVTVAVARLVVAVASHLHVAVVSAPPNEICTNLHEIVVLSLLRLCFPQTVFKYDPPSETTPPHNVYLLPNLGSFIKCDFKGAKLLAVKGLQGLGLVLPFSGGEGLTGMVDSSVGKNLYVSSIFHKSLLKLTKKAKKRQPLPPL